MNLTELIVETLVQRGPTPAASYEDSIRDVVALVLSRLTERDVLVEVESKVAHRAGTDDGTDARAGSVARRLWAELLVPEQGRIPREDFLGPEAGKCGASWLVDARTHRCTEDASHLSAEHRCECGDSRYSAVLEIIGLEPWQPRTCWSTRRGTKSLEEAARELYALHQAGNATASQKEAAWEALGNALPPEPHVEDSTPPYWADSVAVTLTEVDDIRRVLTVIGRTGAEAAVGPECGRLRALIDRTDAGRGRVIVPEDVARG